MQGGTTFYFVTGGIGEALGRAKKAAGMLVIGQNECRHVKRRIVAPPALP
jgi:hypothetical protein